MKANELPECNYENVKAFLHGKYEYTPEDSYIYDIGSLGVETRWEGEHLLAWVYLEELEAFMRLFNHMIADGIEHYNVVLIRDYICIPEFENWVKHLTEEEFNDLFPNDD